MESYCFKCHDSEKMKGDVDLTLFSSVAQMKEDADFWRLAIELIEEEEMPSKKPFPSAIEREEMIAWIDAVVNDRDWESQPHPGHVTLPRLTKTEYNNTMRDLIGLDLRPGNSFLEDGEGQSGFDNDRDGLFVSSSLLEKYFQSAERALTAVQTLQTEPILLHLESEDMFMTETLSKLLEFPGEPGVVGYDVNRGQMTLYDSVDLPSDGFYRFRIRARLIGDLVGAILRIDNEVAGSLRLESPETNIYEVTALARGGSRQIAWNHEKLLTFTGPKGTPPGERKKHSVHIDWIEVEGPIFPAGDAPRVFTNLPAVDSNHRIAARKAIRAFGSRAFRRPIKSSETSKYLSVFDQSQVQGFDYADSLKNAYLGILVSPHFFYRFERFDQQAPQQDGAYRIDPYAFASRLSYFLWLSMPDDELFALAESGEIFEPDVIRAQIARMVKDESSRSFPELFLGQWLGFRALGESVNPDALLFPEYTRSLNEALKAEPVLVMQSLMQNGGSLLDLIGSDRTFLNADLAEHYGIEGIDGSAMREVILDDANRGGLIGMASVLTATSTPVRSSPVLRGVWVLERLLGDHISEPPLNVAALPSDSKVNTGKTLREELEIHRSQEACMNCHQKIDPIGFGLENFDAIGRFRQDDGEHSIDSVGVMPDGQEFDGPVELKRYLMTHRREDFVKNVIERMLSFALGRKLGQHDKPVVNSIFSSIEAENFETLRLVEEIVMSYPFQYHTQQPLDSL